MARFHLRTLARTPGLTLGEGTDAEERLRFSKQLAVLIYLASRPQARATREELIGLLWEGSSPHDARQALRQVVYQIRHGTDRDLLSGDEVLALRKDLLAFDVETFRTHLAGGRLSEAYLVYETDFLSNVALSGAREFEQWAEGMRQQLAAEWRQLLRSLVAMAVDGGNWTDAAQYSARLIERDPYDLEPRIKMVELLALAGDEVRAQAAAEEVRRVAVEIHGERIPAVVATALARAISPTAVPDRRQSRGFPRHPELVGRAAEFRAVVDRWRNAVGGEGGAVLISGEAGIGKTRLARDLERRFQHDPCLVLKSACHTVEQSDPLAPFLEMLREAQAAPGLGAASPSSLEVLGAFIPEIASRFTGTVTPRPAPIPREALSASLLDAYAAIAGELPLALIIEDLDRATTATLEFVHRLARRAQSTHLLVLVTARDVARVPETGRALRDLTGGGVVAEVGLAPLDGTDVRHFIGSIATLPEGESGNRLAERVAKQTAGVPFYVLELLKALYDEGELQVEDGVWRFSERLQDPAQPLPVPESTGAILQKRLEVLGDRPLQVFAALAVRERETSVQDLAYLTGLEMEAVRAALNALERRRLIARQRGMPAALHDELAAAALQRVPHTEARRFHQRAMELAEQSARLGRSAEWSVAAHHAAAGGDIDRAAVNAARAAAAAAQTSGHESARETLQAVLNAMPEAAHSELQARLAPMLKGKRSPRSWLHARAGQRSGWRRYGIPAASAAAAVAAFAIIRAVLAGLGGETSAEPAAAIPFAAETGNAWALGVDSVTVFEPVFPGSLAGSSTDPLRVAGAYDANATSISPGGDRLLAVRQGVTGPEVVLLSVERGVLGRIDWCTGPFAVSWSGDGGRLACVTEGSALALGDAAPGSVPVRVRLPAPISGGPVWSPDGAWVAARVEGDSVYVVDRAGREEPRAVPGRPGAETMLRWERER
jgi:DNA-binding SARP family transcriptional activator